MKHVSGGRGTPPLLRGQGDGADERRRLRGEGPRRNIPDVALEATGIYKA